VSGPAFVEEGDGRAIRHGDYGPFPVEGTIHFVRFNTHEERDDGVVVGGVWPDEETLCGVPIPNWRSDPHSYPIAGHVDCPDCIAARGV